MLTPITISPSRSLLCLVCFFCVSFSMITVMSTVPWYGKIILIGLIICYSYRYLCRHVWLQDPLSAVSVACDSEGLWSMQLANTTAKFAFLRSGSLVTRFLIVLLFTTEDRRRVSVVLTRDNIGLTSFRHVLIHLNHASL